MSVRVFCDDPESLLEEIRRHIRLRKITTWKIDKDGDLTHTPEQWVNLAWMAPKVLEGKLVFNILGSKSKPMSKTTYGVYHGRLIEMLLTHFDLDFTRVSATALASTGDVIPKVDEGA